MVTIAPFRAVRPSSDKETDSFSWGHNTNYFKKINTTYQRFKSEKKFIQDSQENIYVYKQIKNTTGKSYQGLIASVSIDDYVNGKIKIHEKTLSKKEKYFQEHLNICNFSDEPVLMAHPEDYNLSFLLSLYTENSPDFQMKSNDASITHQLWLINNKEHINCIQETFLRFEKIYIADGHHRSASSAFVGQERRKNIASTTGSELFNYFMCLFISFSELEIFSFNRLVKDLNGLSVNEFLQSLKTHFYINSVENDTLRLKSFEMYLDGHWYSLFCKESSYNPTDPIDSLESNILSSRILLPLLGMDNNDIRLEYINGQVDKCILENKVNSGEAIAAFALPVITIQQIQEIADAGKTMPPKSTYIEPKIQPGITIFDISTS